MEKDSTRLIEAKKSDIDFLDRRRSESIDGLNRQGALLSNSLFSAAAVFITIVLAFLGNIKSADTFANAQWLFLASILFFILSIIPWLIDYLLSIRLYSNNAKMCSEMRSHITKANSISALNAVELVELEKLNDKKNAASSVVPGIIQIILFILGLLSSAATIIVCVLG